MFFLSLVGNIQRFSWLNTRFIIRERMGEGQGGIVGVDFRRLLCTNESGFGDVVGIRV